MGRADLQGRRQRMTAPARALARRAFYRHRTVRELLAAGRWLLRRSAPPDLAHLTFAHEKMDGPVQRDEALLLHSLLRVLRPKTVVEIGFFRGYSAFNFLRALDPDARLYSFDIAPACEAIAEELFGHDARIKVRRRSQTDLTAEDIDGRLADFVFLDASHELELNQQSFERLLPLMQPDAILAVHDTGTIPRELLVPMNHWALQVPDLWVDDECEVMPGERAFVNWVLDEHPDISQIHLHSRNTFRCGITLLQRSAPLARPHGETAAIPAQA